MRHFLNLKILWSILNEFETVGPFELDWEAGQYKCRLSQGITLSLLSALQALNLFWLFYIMRIAYRFVVYKTADDDREEDDEEETPEEKAPLVEAIDAGEKPSFAQAATVATGKENGAATGASNGSVRKTRSKKA